MARRSLRHVWRRAREIARAQGWSAVLFTVLGDLGYRRYLLYERRFDDPLPTITARVPVTFAELRPDELDEYLRFHDELPRATLEARFARGDVGIVARHDGRMVGVSWASRHGLFFSLLRCTHELAASEVYLYDAFTDPAFRGLGIAAALGVHVLEHFRAAGATRVTTVMVPENAANRRVREKIGYRVHERIVSVRFRDRRWHWHRPEKFVDNRSRRAQV